MFPATPMPMPGALRLRALHPLIEGDGSCSLIYDLERAAVVEVPEELQFHVAPALETGDLYEALLGWLVNEDLLTSEGRGKLERDGRRRPAPRVGLVEPAGHMTSGSTTSSTSASTRRARTPPWRWWGSCSSRASAPAGSSCT